MEVFSQFGRRSNLAETIVRMLGLDTDGILTVITSDLPATFGIDLAVVYLYYLMTEACPPCTVNNPTPRSHAAAQIVAIVVMAITSLFNGFGLVKDFLLEAIIKGPERYPDASVLVWVMERSWFSRALIGVFVVASLVFWAMVLGLFIAERVMISMNAKPTNFYNPPINVVPSEIIREAAIRDCFRLSVLWSLYLTRLSLHMAWLLPQFFGFQLVAIPKCGSSKQNDYYVSSNLWHRSGGLFITWLVLFFALIAVLSPLGYSGEEARSIKESFEVRYHEKPSQQRSAQEGAAVQRREVSLDG